MAVANQSRLSQYGPFDLDTLVGRLFNGENPVPHTHYGVDVRENADNLYVEAEMPGFRKEEIDITLENSVLTITATHAAAKQASPADSAWLLRERRFHNFSRSFTLPQTVSEQAVEAKLEDGVLTITLRKREESKPRKVQVS